MTTYVFWPLLAMGVISWLGFMIGSLTGTAGAHTVAARIKAQGFNPGKSPNKRGKPRKHLRKPGRPQQWPPYRFCSCCSL